MPPFFDRSRDGAMATKFSDRIGKIAIFHALTFQNGLEGRNADACINTGGDDAPKSCRNFVSFCPVTAAFTRLQEFLLDLVVLRFSFIRIDVHVCLASGSGAKYCNEYVCLSVCLSACLSIRSHNLETARPNFTKLSVSVAWSSSGGVAIR